MLYLKKWLSSPSLCEDFSTEIGIFLCRSYKPFHKEIELWTYNSAAHHPLEHVHGI